MTKQSASKKSKPSAEKPAVEQEKPSSKRKKMGSEIDEIFAAKKKRPAKEENAYITTKKPSKSSGADAKLKEKMTREKGGRSKATNVDNPFSDSSSRSRRKTADGLTIYTEEELGFGKADAGGTRLCPFDCDCCF